MSLVRSVYAERSLSYPGKKYAMQFCKIGQVVFMMSKESWWASDPCVRVLIPWVKSAYLPVNSSC